MRRGPVVAVALAGALACAAASCATGGGTADCSAFGGCGDDLAPEASSSDGAPEANGDAPRDTTGARDAAADVADDDGARHDADAGPVADAAADADADAADSDGDAAVEADADADAPDSGCVVYFHESFDDNSQGWTLDSTWSIAPTCGNPPQPAKGNPDPTSDHTGGDSGVAGAYVCGNNLSGSTWGARYATSPAVDVSSAPSVKLTFWRWLNSDSASYMVSTVDVFDGNTWVNLYANPNSLVTDGSWSRQTYDVTAYASAAMRVRFGYSSVSTKVYVMSDWNVDDVSITTSACP
jgi:hypothetical protein